MPEISKEDAAPEEEFLDEKLSSIAYVNIEPRTSISGGVYLIASVTARRVVPKQCSTN